MHARAAEGTLGRGRASSPLRQAGACVRWQLAFVPAGISSSSNPVLCCGVRGQVRRLVPQVNGDSLRPPGPPAQSLGAAAASDRAPPAPPLAGHDFWGWFQFHTAALEPHRLRFARLFRLQPAHADALAAALGSGASSGAAGELAEGAALWDVIAVHLRLGEGYTTVADWQGGGGDGDARVVAHLGRSAASSAVTGSKNSRGEAPASAGEGGAAKKRELQAGAAGPSESRAVLEPGVPGGVGLGARAPASSCVRCLSWPSHRLTVLRIFSR